MESVEDEHGKLYYEGQILESLSIAFKNLSELFGFYEASIRYSISRDYNATELEQLLASENSAFNSTWFAAGVEFFQTLGLIFLIALTTWVVNRLLFKINFVTTWTEVLLSWILVTVLSPVIGLPLLVIVCSRVLAAIWIRYQYGGKIWLANPFDAVWSFEKPASTSTCVGLYVVEGEGDLEKIRHLLYTRVMLKEVNGKLIYDCFRWCLRQVHGFVCWELLDKFDLNAHIDHFSTRSKTRTDPEKVWTDVDLFEELQAQQDISLNRKNRSPWEILVIPKYDYTNGQDGKQYYAIVFLMNHCLMDGVSMGNILHSCIADKPFEFSVDPIAPLKISKFTVWLAYIISFIMLPRLTITNLFFFERNEFHGPVLTGPKNFTWSRPIRLDTIKEMKNLTKTSVFSVLLSCLGGSMRKLYLKKNYKVPEVINACPPVAILPYPNRNPRNRFSVVLYPLRIGKNTILKRLDAIYKASRKLAASPEVISNYYIVYLLGLMPFSLLKLLAPLAHATMTFSNIPGPTEQVKVLEGDTLMEIGAWIPIKNTIGIGMALFSYKDRLRVTFIGDRASLPGAKDVEFLRDGFESELQELTASLGIEKDKLFISGYLSQS